MQTYAIVLHDLSEIIIWQKVKNRNIKVMHTPLASDIVASRDCGIANPKIAPQHHVTVLVGSKNMWLPLTGFSQSGFLKLASLASEKRIHPKKVGITQAFDLESLFTTFSTEADSKWIPR